MKRLIIPVLFLCYFLAQAQVKLTQQDLTNLISISELYSNNVGAQKSIKPIDSLRTPKLNHIIDALAATSKGDKTILETRFLSRPDNDELMLWYVIREIHYNNQNKSKTKSSKEVATEILAKKIDSRWLLDNYYYRIHGGIATLFNEADLSTVNISIDSLGFKDATEKGIFFLSMVDALIGGRLKVLQMLKNNQKILEFTKKLPKFNSKEYYYYKNFDFEDFDWIGYDKTESYNGVHIGNLYHTLIAQFNATAALGSKNETRELYFNSILREPKYFKYTKLKDDLQALFDK